MSALVKVPVYLRAGDAPEAHIGTIEIDSADLGREIPVAAFLRAAAADLDARSGGDDAAAH